MLHSKHKITLKQFLPILTFLIIAGCGTQSVKEEVPADQIEVARQLFDAGDYTAAAEEYLKLSQQMDQRIENNVDEDDDLSDVTPFMLKRDFQISAAEAYIKASDSLNARKITADIDRTELDSLLMIRYDFVLARIAELDQQPEQVIAALSQTKIPGGSSASTNQKAIQKEILQMRITAYETLESPLEAARSHVMIDPLLESDLEQEENRRVIWATIDQLDSNELDQLRNSSSDPLMEDEPASEQDQLTAWAELAVIAKESLFDAEGFKQKVDRWRSTYPDHQAEEPILAELFEKSESLGQKVSNIALLLPNSGRFAQAGAAVRDGFLSAWYGENNQLDQPMVHVYNAGADNILDTYQHAVEDGADLIVGPLEKSALKTLLSLSELPIRTLALNQLTEEELSQAETHIKSDRFYQFSLTPEQEASQVAEKAWDDGYSHALAITPENAWGDRLYSSFKEKYEELGGVILEHQQFTTTEKADFSGSVTQLLNIDGSKQRFDDLTKELSRRIKFEPRPRKDMDFIFMAATPVQARQIRPQLMFHRASEIPVITTSHAFGLPPRGEPDLDLEGVVIGDMPWMIDHQEIDPETPLSMQQNWPDDNAAFLRLFALGMDAYKIIPQLGRLRLQVGGKFEGETGNLFMNENAQVQRELVWAKFSRGKPQLISPRLREPEMNNSESNSSGLITPESFDTELDPSNEAVDEIERSADQ